MTSTQQHARQASEAGFRSELNGLATVGVLVLVISLAYWFWTNHHDDTFIEVTRSDLDHWARSEEQADTYPEIHDQENL